MSVVEELRLNAGDTFPTKEILQIRIAEEFNLQKIAIATLRSDLCQLLVVGNDFYVKASCRDSGIWKVSTCIVRSEDGSMPDNKYTIEYAAKIAAADAAAAAAAAIVDAADEPRDDMDDQVSVMDSGKVNDDENGGNVPAKTKIVLPHYPYLAKWIVPLIHTTIAETPCASSKKLKNVLCGIATSFV